MSTTRRIEVRPNELDRIAAGTVAESWVGSDRLGLLRQLGVIPGQP